MSTRLDRINLSPALSPKRLSSPKGYRPVSTCVDINGNAIRLLVTETTSIALMARFVQAGWASFPETQTTGEYSSILSISGNSGSSELSLTGMTATFPKIELLSENEVLVVAPRCQRFSGGKYEMNAVVYNRTGKAVRDFLLGDGIEHIQVDEKAQIWVGYSDEGVFGNYGWNSPVGAAGLCCFSSSGEKIWDYAPPVGFDPICDCYALNVARNSVWSYYYTDFPIAQIDAELRVRCWSTKVPGARALAAGQDKILLFGGYEDQRSVCTLLHLDDGVAESVAEIKLILPRSIDIRIDKVIGRDKQLHVFMDENWYVFSIDGVS
jgi:hypothetical protein